MSKEIVYQREVKKEIIEHNVYRGYEYYIVNYGIHPCAYVEDKWGYEKEVYDSMNVHGGVTFFEIPDHFDESQKKKFIGWDYAHYGDYSGIDDLNKMFFIYEGKVTKKWTYEEILEDIHNVIEQIENQIKKEIK